MMNMEPHKPKRLRRRMTPDERREALDRKNESIRQKAATCGQLREAMELISGLPRPKDMAEIVRFYDRNSFVKRRIPTIAQWMKELEHAYNSSSHDDDEA